VTGVWSWPLTSI